MSGTIVAHLGASELLTLVVHWLTLWLGLYLLSRRPRSAATALAGLAFLTLSGYLVNTAILFAPEPSAEAVFWGSWVGVWVPLAPALLLHAFLYLTGTRLSRQRSVLAVVYGAAAAVVLLGFSDTLLYHYWAPGSQAATNGKGFVAIGPLYPVQVVQVVGTSVLALAVLLRVRRARPAPAESVRPQLNMLIAGTALMLLGASLMFANAYVGAQPIESLLQPILVVGGMLVAAPLAGYPGLLEGQLLRSDLKSSLLGATLLMACFVALVFVAGASSELVAGLGWFVLAVFVFGDDLRALADRAFYGAGSRAGRAGLRTAATYAGSLDALDLSALSPGRSSEVVDYLSALDRAALASAQLEGPNDARLALLDKEEFAPVRGALGLSATWTSADGLPYGQVREHVAASLEPRERQALGLRYLGYSDKEMARLMGVKPNVPRSYLSEGKRKLGLPAGARLMLFVFLSGLVDSDALPLLSPSQREAASPQKTTDVTTSASAERPA